MEKIFKYIDTDAPRWKFFLAKMFGEKVITIEKHDVCVTLLLCYKWKGVLYIADYNHLKSEHPEFSYNFIIRIPRSY